MNKDKTKVLIFPIANSRGGCTQYALQVWKHIDRSRFQIDFGTMNAQLDFAKQLEDEGCKICKIACYAEKDEKKFEDEIRQILLDGRYDVVHLLTNQWKSMTAEKVAKEVGIRKIIIHAQNTGITFNDEQERKLQENRHYEVRSQLNSMVATDFWACSKAAADFIYGDQIVEEQKVVMRNAIDLGAFSYNVEVRERYRKELGLENMYVIGVVGRFVHQKNQEFLIEVFAEICKQRDNCRLLLVGTGEKEKEYRNIVRQERLEDQVLFMGLRSDVNCLLQAMDCFCMPSRFEGLGIALIEAQASGVKCVVSDSIVDEAIVSDLVTRIPLDKKRWIAEICDFEEQDRDKYAQVVRSAGYAFEDEIHNIERGYLKGLV